MLWDKLSAAIRTKSGYVLSTGPGYELNEKVTICNPSQFSWAVVASDYVCCYKGKTDYNPRKCFPRALELTMGTNRTVEIRTYRLKLGTGARFKGLYESHYFPLLASVNMDLVKYHFSNTDPDSFLLIRSFDSQEHFQTTEDEFYDSDAWRKGPRKEILSMIEELHDVVLMLPTKVVEGIRATNKH